jgi:hypothetical protein
MSSMLSGMLSFNYNQLKNIKAKTELNPNALEFIPENQEKGNFKQIEKEKFDDKFFDNLEKSFVKNNEWLFYV